MNESKDEENKDGGQPSDKDLFNIKFILILKKPTRGFVQSGESGGFQSIARRSIHVKNTRIKEILMSIAIKCKGNHLSLFVDTVSDLIVLFESGSPAVENFL